VLKDESLREASRECRRQQPTSERKRTSGPIAVLRQVEYEACAERIEAKGRGECTGQFSASTRPVEPSLFVMRNPSCAPSRAARASRAAVS
jgi:hypothetical protein